MKITLDQFEEWKKEHPVSIEFFKFIGTQAAMRRAFLSAGMFNRDGSFADIGEEVIRALMSAEAFEEVLKTEFEDLEDDDEEDTTSRVPRSGTTGEG